MNIRLQFEQFMTRTTSWAWVLLIVSAGLLVACAGEQTLTREEVQMQQRASDALTQILFEHELDELTSYGISKQGFVNLTITGMVPPATYTQAIEALRAHPDIRGVLATQGGVEVCPLSR